VLDEQHFLKGPTSAKAPSEISEMRKSTATISPARGVDRRMPQRDSASTKKPSSPVRLSCQNARLAAAAALDRLRQADVDGSAVACAKALDEAKQHWIIPPLS
jgi:hypothetical protein